MSSFKISRSGASLGVAGILIGAASAVLVLHLSAPKMAAPATSRGTPSEKIATASSGVMTPDNPDEEADKPTEVSNQAPTTAKPQVVINGATGLPETAPPAASDSPVQQTNVAESLKTTTEAQTAPQDDDLIPTLRKEPDFAGMEPGIVSPDEAKSEKASIEIIQAILYSAYTAYIPLKAKHDLAAQAGAPALISDELYSTAKTDVAAVETAAKNLEPGIPAQAIWEDANTSDEIKSKLDDVRKEIGREPDETDSISDQSTVSRISDGLALLNHALAQRSVPAQTTIKKDF